VSPHVTLTNTQTKQLAQNAHENHKVMFKLCTLAGFYPGINMRGGVSHREGDEASARRAEA